MLRSYLKGSKLRAWLSRPDCPPAIKEVKVILDLAYGIDDKRNSSIDDDPYVTDTARTTTVPEDLHELTGERKTVIRAHLNHAGVLYSEVSTNAGNSQIIFYPNGNHSASPIPGIIKYIFEQDGTMLLAVQRRYQSSGCSIFSSYPHFPAKVYQTRPASKLEKVKISWIVGHYASWPVSLEQVIILSLSRVSLPHFHNVPLTNSNSTYHQD